MQKPARDLRAPKNSGMRPCCGDCDQTVHRPRFLQNLWSKALTKKVAHSEAAIRRARFTAITVKQMVGKLEKSWERRSV